MKLNLEELKEIASAATPGPWHHDSGNGQVETEEWRIEIVNAVSNSDRQRDITYRFEDSVLFKEAYDIIAKHDVYNDMDHIAAFNPTVALALIERIENLESALHHLDSGFDFCPEAQTIISKALAKYEKWKAGS
jgi:hypothetical protein